MIIPNNEGRCLDAVIRVLELELGQKRKNLISPEQSGHKHPVELVCEIGDMRYALEHTIVQSFSNQIGDGINFIGMTDALITELVGRLPENIFFQVVMSVGATDGIKKHKISNIRTSLREWIVSVAQRLKINESLGTECETPDGVPFSVRLNWQSWRAPTKIHFVRSVPAGIDESRLEQLVTGIRSKIVKLQGWGKVGVQDILILENWDGALSNIEIIKNNFEAASKQFEQIPSNVYVVDTCFESMWTVWTIRRDDIAELSPKFLQIDPRKLVDPRTGL